jgi:hypothetical protein
MHPLVQRIWANPDCLLLIFVGSSAEFALNPHVDWLFYTGRLPADPILRLQTTLNYMRGLLFAPPAEQANRARGLKKVHAEIEARRGQTLPNEGYLDVLSMDVRYTIDAHELVTGRPLDDQSKDDIAAAFGQLGRHMGLTDVPGYYAEFLAARARRQPALVATEWSWKLLTAYRRALGPVGYHLLRVVYGSLVEPALLAQLKVRKGLRSGLVRRVTTPVCRWGLNWPAYRALFPPLLWNAVTDWRDRPSLALE